MHEFVLVKDETSVYHKCTVCQLAWYPDDMGDIVDCVVKCEHGNIDTECSACMYAANE